MSVLDRLDKMVKAGVPYETALGLARGFEADIEAAIIRGAKAVAESIGADAQAVARRVADRDRKREAKALKDAEASFPQNSAETLSEGSQGSLSPRPPNLPNPPNLSQEPPIVPQTEGKTVRKAKPPKGVFARFWAEYPLKVGKGKAEPAFDRAWRRCETDDPEAEILDGLHRCAPLWDSDFIPHPTTWLNRDGWLDQPIPEDTGAKATGPPRFDLAAFEERRRRQNETRTEDAA